MAGRRPGREWQGVLPLDFSGLAYLSMAGRRRSLIARKTMNRPGGMAVRHGDETIPEVLELTGFREILTIE